MIILELTEERFTEIVNDAVRAAIPRDLTSNNPEAPIKGIHELARFLRISPGRCQKLKNEGVFEYFQDGRTILFDPVRVRLSFQGLQKKATNYKSGS